MSFVPPERIFVEIPQELENDVEGQEALRKSTLAQRQAEDPGVISGYIDFIDASRKKLGIVLVKSNNPPMNEDDAVSGSGLGVYDLIPNEVD